MKKYDQIVSNVHALMPDIVEDLEHLIRYPSVAFPGYPSEPVNAMAEATVAVLQKYGLKNARLVAIPQGYPAVYGEIPAPPGMPTVLIYAHYDVQPGKREDGWKTNPWDPVTKDGRVYGRGATDDKSGIVIAAAAVKVFDGNTPIGVKILIEGEEETNSHLPEFVAAHPDLFLCDAFIILDNINLSAGRPALTTTLRGVVSCIIEVRTLDHAVHSGMFGGPAPDALVSLIRILSTLHDAQGDVAVKGLALYDVKDREYPADQYRKSAGILPQVDLIGTGSLGSRLWSGPSITVIGIDAPSISTSSNILIPRAAAKISMRISPDADAEHELQVLVDHLRSVAPWNVQVSIQKDNISPGFVCPTDGPGFAAASKALELAFGNPVQVIGAGGSIPLLRVLHTAVPGAEFVLCGAGDAESSRIHGTDESVSIHEIEQMIIAQCLFLEMFRRVG